MNIIKIKWGFNMKDIDYKKIPKHLRYLSVEKLRALFYLFRGGM